MEDSIADRTPEDSRKVTREISAQNPRPWIRLSEASNRGVNLSGSPAVTSDLITMASPRRPTTLPGAPATLESDPFSAAFGSSEPGGLSLNEIVIETREDAIKRSRTRNKNFSLYGKAATVLPLPGAGSQDVSPAGSSSSAKVVLENMKKPGTKAYEVSAAIVSVHGSPSKDKNTGTGFSMMAGEAANAAQRRLADGKGASPAPTQILNTTEPLFRPQSATQALAHLDAAGAALARASASALGTRTDTTTTVPPQSAQVHARTRNVVDMMGKITTPRSEAHSSAPPPAAGSQAPTEGSEVKNAPSLPPRMKYRLPAQATPQAKSEAGSVPKKLASLPSPRRK
jgi:hypothetical protein